MSARRERMAVGVTVVTVESFKVPGVTLFCGMSEWAMQAGTARDLGQALIKAADLATSNFAHLHPASVLRSNGAVFPLESDGDQRLRGDLDGERELQLPVEQDRESGPAAVGALAGSADRGLDGGQVAVGGQLVVDAVVAQDNAHVDLPSVGQSSGGTGSVDGATALITPSADVPTVGAPTDTPASFGAGVSVDQGYRPDVGRAGPFFVGQTNGPTIKPGEVGNGKPPGGTPQPPAAGYVPTLIVARQYFQAICGNLDAPPKVHTWAAAGIGRISDALGDRE